MKMYKSTKVFDKTTGKRMSINSAIQRVVEHVKRDPIYLGLKMSSKSTRIVKSRWTCPSQIGSINCYIKLIDESMGSWQNFLSYGLVPRISVSTIDWNERYGYRMRILAELQTPFIKECKDASMPSVLVELHHGRDFVQLPMKVKPLGPLEFSPENI